MLIVIVPVVSPVESSCQKIPELVSEAPGGILISKVSAKAFGTKKTVKRNAEIKNNGFIKLLRTYNISKIRDKPKTFKNKICFT
jgi:hypothetical protein